MMLTIFLIILLLLYIATLVGGFCMARFACVRRKDTPDYWSHPEALPKPNKHIPESELPETLAGREFLLSHQGEPIHIQSRDGLKLVAHYIPPAPAGEPANARTGEPVREPKGIYLQVHGYRSHPICDFAGCEIQMHTDGYGLFLIDQRACGGSEGKMITFGLKERYDVVDWCVYLHEHFPGVPVLLDGVSMGSATVLLASGEDLPDNVVGIIADCGYTSPAAICKKVLRQWFHLPPFPLYYAAVLWIRILTGEWFSLPGHSDKVRHRTGDVTYALTKNKLPLLIAHGENDTFVPHRMGKAIYNSCKEKDVTFLSVPDAEHGMSWLLDKERYRKEIRRLWNGKMKNE